MARTVLGIIECDMVANVQHELTPWKAEQGYRLAALVVRCDAEHFELTFDGAQHPLRLDDATQIPPIGLMVCFNDGFRHAPGQNLPPFLSASSIHVAVTSGNCFGLVYALEEIREPDAIGFEGAWSESLVTLQATEAVGTGLPRSIGLAFPSGATLRGHVPFCDPLQGSVGFSRFKPVAAQCGIRAIGAHEGAGIVSIRVPLDEARKIGAIQPQDVRLELHDGTTLESTGLVISAQGLATPEQLAEFPTGVMDKGLVGPDSISLGGHGTVRLLSGYHGPYCGYSSQDCKIVVAFGRTFEWQQVETAIVGGYFAQQIPGAAVYVG